MDLAKLSERLGDTRALGFAKAHGTMDPQIQLAFWSLTCSPCLEKLSKYGSSYSTNIIIPVNVDPDADLEEAKATLEKLAPSFTFYHDKDRYMMNTFKVDYLPTYVFLDQKGFIKDIQSGPSIE